MAGVGIMMLLPASDTIKPAQSEGIKPPHALELERALLGAILLYNQCVDSFSDNACEALS